MGDFGAAHDGAASARRTRSDDVSVTHRVLSDGPLLVVRGTLSGAAALGDLGNALDAVVRSAEGDVVVDLSGVDEWSLLAQAMLLNSARLLASRGRRMSVRGVSVRLRRTSRQLGVLDRLATVS